MKLVATAIVACLIAFSAFAQQIPVPPSCEGQRPPYYVMVPNRDNLREISMPITIASARVYLDGDLLHRALDRVEQGILARCPAIDLIEVRLQKIGTVPFFYCMEAEELALLDLSRKPHRGSCRHRTKARGRAACVFVTTTDTTGGAGPTTAATTTGASSVG